MATSVFQISPSNVTGLNGAHLVISCYADSNPSVVRWTVDGIAVVPAGSLRLDYADGEAVVTFSPLGYQHEGVYRCTAYDSSGGELFTSYPGRVRVYGEWKCVLWVCHELMSMWRTAPYCGVRGCLPFLQACLGSLLHPPLWACPREEWACSLASLAATPLATPPGCLKVQCCKAVRSTSSFPSG